MFSNRFGALYDCCNRRVERRRRWKRCPHIWVSTRRELRQDRWCLSLSCEALCVAFDAALLLSSFFGSDVISSTDESPSLSYLFTLVANVVNESCSSRSASSRALRFPALFSILCGVFMCSSSFSATWLPAKPSVRRYDPATCNRELLHVNTLPSLSAQRASNMTSPEVAVAAPLLRSAVLSAAAVITSPQRVAVKTVFGGAPLCTGFRFIRLKQQALKSHPHLHASDVLLASLAPQLALRAFIMRSRVLKRQGSSSASAFAIAHSSLQCHAWLDAPNLG
jgi:hypothetical protein